MNDMQTIVHNMVVSVVDDRMQSINGRLETLCRKVSVICDELQSAHEKKLERIRETATINEEGVRATDISKSVQDVFTEFFDDKDDKPGSSIDMGSERLDRGSIQEKPGLDDKPIGQNVVPVNKSSLASRFGKFDDGCGEVHQIV